MGLYWQNFSKWLGHFLEFQGVIQILEFCKVYSEITLIVDSALSVETSPVQFLL